MAAVLSFFIPGAGQLYKGQIGAGVAWFVFVLLGYVALVIPGLIAHLACVLHAASGARPTASTVPPAGLTRERIPPKPIGPVTRNLVRVLMVFMVLTGMSAVLSRACTDNAAAPQSTGVALP